MNNTLPFAVKLHLPVPSTSFLGREQELTEISNLLADPACRLLTLTGQGGIGKTRLAIEAAKQQADAFAHGVYFVSLAGLRSAEEILPAIAQKLAFQSEDNAGSDEYLTAYLHHKQLLLVLDNFEHLVQGSTLVANILVVAPAIRILVTSREALNLQEEWVRPVHGLSFPVSFPAQHHHTDAGIEAFSAVQLFCERARRIRGDFRLTDDAGSVALICQLVEGMPLALELAAAWLRTLACAEIAHEIQHSIDFLSSTVRNLPEAHRSIRAVFERSWAFLSPNEQRIFSSLSVFRGGFLQEDAAQITGASLLDFTAFVDKSLLRRSVNGRFDIHELLRRFAEDKLDTSGNGESVRQKHADHYLNFLAKRQDDLHGKRQIAALDEIEADLQNVRTAWLRAIQHEDLNGLNRAADAMVQYHYMRTRWSEADELFTPFLDRYGFPVDYSQSAQIARLILFALRIRALIHPTSALDKYCDWLQRRLHVAIECHDVQEIAFCRYIFGFMLVLNCDSHEAVLQLTEARTLYQSLGDKFYEGHVLQHLAHAYLQLEQDSEAIRESLELRRAIGDVVGVIGSLLNLSSMAFEQGQYAEAERGLRDARNIALDVGNWARVAWAANSLALISFCHGDYDESRLFITEAIDIATNLNLTDNRFHALTRAGNLAIAEHQYEQAGQISLMLRAINSPVADLLEGQIAYTLRDTATVRERIRSFLSAGDINCYLEDQLVCAGCGSFVLSSEGQYERATELIASAFQQGEFVPGYVDQLEIFAEQRTALKEMLPEAVYEAAWARGAKRELDETLKELAGWLGVQTVVSNQGGTKKLIGPHKQSKGNGDALSQRELEVLQLTAAGLSNREIAEQLVVGVSTVKKHINHLYDKLGVKSRTQAIARARALNILP